MRSVNNELHFFENNDFSKRQPAFVLTYTYTRLVSHKTIEPYGTLVSYSFTINGHFGTLEVLSCSVTNCRVQTVVFLLQFLTHLVLKTEISVSNKPLPGRQSLRSPSFNNIYHSIADPLPNESQKRM